MRFVLIGGFLGAGKTTTISRLARLYQQRGLDVGIITNDQADDLVDTLTLRSAGFDVAQVSGACFCCSFNDLIQSTEALLKASGPDIILAEPVGSCTDLVATVIRPLMRLYGDRFSVSSYTVILKPEFARALVDHDIPAGLQKSIYIFLKQIEEADIIVVNKVDELSPEELQRLVRFAKRINPAACILPISARTGEGLERMVEVIDASLIVGGRNLDLDYDTYAEGEAALGWLNSRVSIFGANSFDLDQVVATVSQNMFNEMKDKQSEIAHIKVCGTNGFNYSVANVVDRFRGVVLSSHSAGSTRSAELTINARVAIDPNDLEQALMKALEFSCSAHGLNFEVRLTTSFRPSRPVPSHRYPSSTDMAAP